MTDTGRPTLKGIVPLLQVSSITDTINYYREVLEFEIEWQWPDASRPRWAVLRRDDVRFMFTIDLGTSTGPFIAEKGNGMVLYVICDDIATLYENVQARGAILVQDLIEFGGRKQFSVADPNGYAVAFSEPLVQRRA